MPKFNVHLYREMRAYFPGIEADNAHSAVRIANEKPTDEAALVEDCDGKTYAALVDVDGDTEYVDSTVIDLHPDRARLEAALCIWEELLRRYNQSPRPVTLEDIRADERAKCVAEIRAMNAAQTGHEWVAGSLWHNILERAARTIAAPPPQDTKPSPDPDNRALIDYWSRRGTVEMRQLSIALADYCLAVYDLIPSNTRDSEPYDWGIIPAILTTIDWTNPHVRPPAHEAAAIVTNALDAAEARARSNRKSS